ncbi:M15 family metallopeptidase [Amycolatopsis sp. WAC 01416]|uniref:M15 family metallopeptidase n=1 Tax=Amycolatopsis sp. WAC 01416 TaxID=2203196 RepID=UPI0021047876|nr:M15 family metallopeptidase [Amycolatopsis sp. WAC 01416]
MELPPRPQRPYRPGETLVPCYAPDRFPDNTVDMGTGYDTLSNTDDPRIPGEARANRQLLKNTLAAARFRNLAEEWWHYTFNGEPFPDTYFDFPSPDPR